MAATATIIDGLDIPMQIIRRAIWAATNGNYGVVKPADLRVYALPTPGPGVFVAKGGAMILSTYPTASGEETYPFVNDAAFQLNVPQTPSSGGRTDYVIARIRDWNFNGSQEPADLDTATGCSIERVTASELAQITDPYVKLAQITIPASTATITNAMIKDLRNMAVQQSKTNSVMNPIVAGDQGLVLNSKDTAGEVFPNTSNTAIDIPTWATRAKIAAYWTAVRYSAGKNCFGRYWVRYANVNGTDLITQQMAFDATGVSNNSAANWILLDEVPIPASIRGTTQSFFFKARYDSTDKGVSLTTLSGVALEVQFLGNADPDIVEID